MRQQQNLDYSIWSFCFAKGQVPRDFIEGSPVGSNKGLLQIPMVYSVIAASHGDRNRDVILVDTGFASGRSMTGRAFADFEEPNAILAKIALEPRDVSTVVLTHMHFDHIGNIDAFPNARLVLQRSEYEGWKHALNAIDAHSADKANWILSSMNLDDIVRLERAKEAGRLLLIDGVHEVRPGIVLRPAPDSHTFGSQWVEISVPEGAYVIAGDVIASYSNFERMWPPGYHQGNAWNLLAAYRTIGHILGEGGTRRLVPGHDMELFRRTPSWISGRNPAAQVRLAAGARSFIR